MYEIIGTITKSVLLAVVSSAATILINEFWTERNVAKTGQQFDMEDGRPGYHF